MTTALTTLEILVAGRAFIADPKHWIQGEMARDAKGRATNPTAADATCWCSLGALYKVNNPNTGGFTPADAPKSKKTAWTRLDAASLSLGESGKLMNFIKFNDTHTHAEVLGMWDRAITAAKETA